MDKNYEVALSELEHEHLVAQPKAWPHTYVHWKMFLLALKFKKWREASGQVPRIFIAGLGSYLGKAPRGNVGSTKMGIFEEKLTTIQPKLVIELKGKSWIGFLAMTLIIQYILSLKGFQRDPRSLIQNIGIFQLSLLSSLESLFEELLFRFFPLFLIIKYKKRTSPIVAVCILSSIAFAFWHINSLSKVELMVAGLIYCGIFLLAGGLSENYKKALFSTWLVHTTLNLSWIFLS